MFSDEYKKWQKCWDKVIKEKNNNPKPNKEPVYAWDNSFEEEELLHERMENPIYADTVGKDQDGPEPLWVNEKLLKNIEELKNKLYDMEVKLNTEDGGGGKWVEKCHHPKDKVLLQKIAELKKQIDKVSDNLGLE